MRRRAALPFLLLLAACSQPAYQGKADQKLDAHLTASPKGDAAATQAGGAKSPRAAMLPCSYPDGLEVALDQISPLIRRHRSACARRRQSLSERVGFF